MFSVQSLSKKFDNLTVLDGFCLELRRGGFTVLVGPSGCGKTSFFDLLCGVVSPDGGALSWCGRTRRDLGSAAAYMQQKDLLLPWLPLIDNALLPLRVKGAVGTGDRKKALDLFERFGLGGFESYLPGQVSGGMRQRCALVRTLLFGRELVLLDEPLSALDAITRQSLQELLLSLQTDYGRTLLMITHDVEEALLLGEEVVVLSGPPLRVVRTVRPVSPRPRNSTDSEVVRLRAEIFEELRKGMVS